MNEQHDRAGLLYKHYWQGKTSKQCSAEITKLNQMPYGYGGPGEESRLTREEKIEILRSVIKERSV